jgi:hypothetical protein
VLKKEVGWRRRERLRCVGWRVERTEVRDELLDRLDGARGFAAQDASSAADEALTDECVCATRCTAIFFHIRPFIML